MDELDERQKVCLERARAAARKSKYHQSQEVRYTVKIFQLSNAVCVITTVVVRVCGAISHVCQGRSLSTLQFATYCRTPNVIVCERVMDNDRAFVGSSFSLLSSRVSPLKHVDRRS